MVRFRMSGYRRFSGPITDLIESHGYQPLYGVDETEHPEVRTLYDRWSAMEPHLPSSGSALDIGCQNGWFTFALADRGLFALGVDGSERRIQTPRLLAMHHNSERAAFTRMTVTSATAGDLPTVDVVLCLSVFHHVARSHGLDEAIEIMRILADKTRHQLCFETGQPNETTRWAPELNFMGDDPEAWVEELVASLGFEHVTKLASTPGIRGQGSRVLVLGSRQPSDAASPETST